MTRSREHSKILDTTHDIIATALDNVTFPDALDFSQVFTVGVGGQSTFTVQYEVGFLSVYVNGIRLAPADITATNGTSVTLVAAAVEGDIVTCDSYTAVDLAALPAGTVAEASLADGAVTTAKLGADAVNGDKIADDAVTSEHIGELTSIAFGSSKWTIELDAGDNDLNFKYNGTTVFKLASTGEVISSDDITAFGSP